MSDQLSTHQNKFALFEEWMQDDHVMVHIDGRPDEVSLPDHLKSNPALTLKLSYRFQGSTVVTKEEIRAQLLFGERYFEVVIPWKYLWGMTSTDGVQKIWPESVPADVMRTYLVARLKELSNEPAADVPADTDESSAGDTQKEVDRASSGDSSRAQKAEPHARPVLTVATSGDSTSETPREGESERPRDKKVQKLSRPHLKLIK